MAKRSREEVRESLEDLSEEELDFDDDDDRSDYGDEDDVRSSVKK